MDANNNPGKRKGGDEGVPQKAGTRVRLRDFSRSLPMSLLRRARLS